MSTPQKGTPRKLSTPSRIPRPSRGTTTCTPMENYGTPRRGALTPVKARTPTRRVPVESHSSASKQSENDRGEEGITVAIRMRPLNAKESTNESSASAVANRVWRVLPQYNSIAQTTPSGQPMQERINGRTYFAFDKTFGEQSTTREIYDGVAKGIVSSVVTGLNGTIFAYGQTSSGKTYTMQGSGSIEDGNVNGGGGIVHMAAADIFSYIENTQDRIFLVRASFIEIYNEDVRDLLGNNETLQIREDPRRGVFVTAAEEIVTDYAGLLEILFGGEKNRSVASTNMNERSSRSHTIFRITIESRCKHTPDDESDETIDTDDDAVRVSTLNLVDLAGSESVRLTGATGDRQKEGGKINQSLLTLSRVIVGLGQPGKAHINFRDSKLTRILQPSLSGNARMAVVCCATPSELYLEETRSTLMFASRAKLVKTHATVNEVLDDRSLIKKLQRELAEARLRSSGGNHDHVLALQAQAAQSGSAARDAEEKLRKLKASILNTGVLMSKAPVEKTRPIRKKRRLSDSLLYVKTDILTPTKSLFNTIATPRTVPKQGKENHTKLVECLSPTSELSIVRYAVAAKAVVHDKTQSQLKIANEMLMRTEAELKRVSNENFELIKVCSSTNFEVRSLESNLTEIQTEYQKLQFTTEQAISVCQGQLEIERNEKKSLQARVAQLEHALTETETTVSNQNNLALQADTKISEIVLKNQKLEDELSKTLSELENMKAKSDKLIAETKTHADAEIATMILKNKKLKEDSANVYAKAEEVIAKLKTTSESKISEAMEVQISLRSQINLLTSQISQEEKKYFAEINALKNEVADLTDKKDSIAKEKDRVCDQHQKRVIEIAEKQAELEGLLVKITHLERVLNHSETENTQLQSSQSELESNLHTAVSEIGYLKQRIEELNNDKASLDSELDQSQKTLKEAHDQIATDSASIADRDGTIDSLTTKIESYEAQLQSNQDILEAAQKQNHDLDYSLSESRTSNAALQRQIDVLLNDINELQELRDLITEKESTIDRLTHDVDSARVSEETTSQSLKVMQQHVETLEATISSLKSQSSEEVSMLVEEKQSIAAAFDAQKEVLVALTKEHEELNKTADSLQASLLSSHTQVEECQAEILDLSLQKSNMIKALSEEKSKGEHFQSEHNKLELQLKETRTSIGHLQSENEELSKNLMVFSASTDDVSNLKSILTSLKSEQVELTQLLSSTTESLIEARASADTAESNLKLRQHSLEESLTMLAKNDEDLCSFRNRIVELEAQLRDHGTSDTRLIELEQQLQKEGSDRDVTEAALKLLMGEEQRSLINEAENTMAALRNENEKLKIALSQVEAGAYSLKQEFEELFDQNKRMEQRAISAEAWASSQRSDITNYELKVEKLTSENRRLVKEVQTTKASIESQIDRNDVENAKTEAKMNFVRAECFSAKQRIAELEENVRISRVDKEGVEIEIQSLREKYKQLESQFEQAQKNHSVQMIDLLANKENASEHPQSEILKRKIAELTKDIQSKDRRIKKLELVKLTKEQCDALKKMKTEREEYQQQAKESLRRLREAEKEIVALKALVGSSIPKRNGDEIAALIFERDALETKLRKYAAHCQRLESDKATIVDALSSCNRNKIVDGDLAGAIVSLCDNFSSLEEECDALTSAETRASSYLMEIESIRNQVTELEDRNAKLIKSEADLAVRLAEAVRQITAVQIERDKLKGSVEYKRGHTEVSGSDKSRQVKYLEQENLSLIMNLKATRKQLQSARSELDTMKMRAEDTDAVGLESVSMKASAFPLTQLPNSQGHIPIDLQTSLDKENVPNHDHNYNSMKPVNESISGKIIGTRSTRKARRDRNSSTLGEPGIDDDNTQNCQQS